MSRQILVIDDDFAIRKSFTMALEGMGCKVDTAQSGEEGIDKVSKNEYDLVFLDIKMLGINGVEAMIRMRDDECKMPIYMITAFHEEFVDQLKVAAKRGYNFEIIQKPIRSEHLVRITRAILEGAQTY